MIAAVIPNSPKRQPQTKSKKRAPVCGKVCFSGMVEARDMMEKIRKQSGLYTQPIRCFSCTSYHLIFDIERVNDDDYLLMGLVAQGFTYGEIGKMYGLTYKTVACRFERMVKDTAAMNVMQLVAVAARLGLIETALISREGKR